MTRAAKRWEAGDALWQSWIAKDKQRAEATQKPAEPQCCFGIGAGKRCKNPANFSRIYYGFPTGLSMCRHHRRTPDRDEYPHGWEAIP